MNWYSGSIAEAVQKSKKEGAVFFVAIFGTDEPSKNLEAAVNDSAVKTELSSNRYVCIRLVADSQEHVQFKEIYAEATAPCLYFVSLMGAPIEIIYGGVTAKELKEKCGLAWLKHSTIVLQAQLQVQAQPAATNSGSASAVADQQQAPTAPASSSNATPPTGSRENTPKPENVPNDQDESADTSNLTLNERIERARRLAAARQKLKQEEEAEEARQREKERREAGRGMAELKRWQDEQEAKKLVEERKREKREEQLLRQKLRDQIAQDRAERNKRTNASIVYDGAEPGPSSTPPKPTASTSNATPVDYTGKARLQFRMPDGSSQSHSFEQDVTLGHVRKFLRDEGHVRFANFSLCVAFPRRDFSTVDYEKSLKDLGLLPSATLLVIPAGGKGLGAASGSGGAGIWSMFTALMGYILYPVTLLFGIFQRALPSTGTAAGNQAPGESQSSSGASRGENRLGGSGAGASYRSQNADRRNPTAGPSTAGTGSPSTSGDVRKRNVKPERTTEGNIHRLRNQESDSDDELGTWNGNSTQQKPR